MAHHIYAYYEESAIFKSVNQFACGTAYVNHASRIDESKIIPNSQYRTYDHCNVKFSYFMDDLKKHHDRQNFDYFSVFMQILSENYYDKISIIQFFASVPFDVLPYDDLLGLTFHKRKSNKMLAELVDLLFAKILKTDTEKNKEISILDDLQSEVTSIEVEGEQNNSV